MHYFYPLKMQQQIIMMGHNHVPMDDDDISQHEIMDNKNDSCNETEEVEVAQFNQSTTSSGGGGYRRIEEWNDEHIRNNPDEHNPLTHLKREKARWIKAFDCCLFEIL